MRNAVGTVGVTKNVNMIIACMNLIMTRAVLESSRNSQVPESSENTSSVEFEEQVSILPLVASYTYTLA